MPEAAALRQIMEEIGLHNAIANDTIKPTVYATWNSQPETKILDDTDSMFVTVIKCQIMMYV